MKNTTTICLAAAGALSLAGILMAERSDFPIPVDDPRLAPPEERVSRALFDALHDRTVDSFSKRVGFGMSRIAAAPRNHIGMEDLWTIIPPDSAGYDVELIGLENEASGRVYSVKPLDVPAGAASAVAQLNRPEEETQSGVLPGAVDLAEFVELTAPPREVEISPASDFDREMIEFLEEKREAPMLTDGADKVVIYGAVRANKQRCIACHECEPGTLLGAFRYTFELAPEGADALASTD